MRYGVRLFAEVNLNPHYWPFRGIALSLVVHASLLTGLITIPLLLADDERPRFEEAIILDADDLKDVLYLPVLGGERPPQTARNTDQGEVSPAAPAKEGLSYPGPQPILSKFPVPSNHTQTILQPALKDPPLLDLSFPLPNMVRLPPPEVLRKLTVPDAPSPPLQPPPMLAARPEIPLAETAKPLAAPSADSRLKVLDPVTSVARPSTAPTITAQLDSISGPTGPLAAPRVESRMSVLDPATAVARPTQSSSVPLDPAIAAPSRPLAAPVAESKFRIPEQTTSIARPALPVPAGEPSLAVSGPTRPLAAPAAESKMRALDPAAPQVQTPRTTSLTPLSVPTTDAGRALAAPAAESKLKVLDSSTPQTQPARTTQVVPLGVPTTAGPSRPLAAPVAESKLKVSDSTAPPTQLTRSTQVAPLNVPTAVGPTRPLAAPVAESKIKVADSATPIARPSPQGATPKLDVPLSDTARPLAAPRAESRIKVPDATAPVGRQAAPAVVPLDVSQIANQPMVALSPMPARRDQPAAVPAGEARGEFAISPQPNLTFPGTEPGGRASASNTTAANNNVTGLGNTNKTTSGSTSTAAANSPNATPGAGANVFPGITILGAETGASVSSRNSTSSTSSATSSAADKSVAPPLQTSYGISILASGASGGGLPDFGVFGNEQVHTVYLDMRRTIQDESNTWTVEFGVKQPEATAESERVATVGRQQEVILPFPIDKERPVMPVDLVRRYSGRLVIAYAVVTPEGKMEQLSIKQSPDPALNEIVLSALRKWTFRPGRRNGEVTSAKILLGIPVRAD